MGLVVVLVRVTHQLLPLSSRPQKVMFLHPSVVLVWPTFPPYQVFIPFTFDDLLHAKQNDRRSKLNETYHSFSAFFSYNELKTA